MQEKSRFFFPLIQRSLDVPKSSGLINEKERQIVARVRQVRYANQLSQSEFARALGISLDRLASIEYARTPLTVAGADKISSKFDVSLIWLAEGRGRMKPCFGLISQSRPEIRGSELLSAVFSADLERRLIEENFFSMFSMAVIMQGEAGLPKGKDAEHYVESFYHAFDDLFHKMPHLGKEKLLALMVRTLAEFSTDWEEGDHKAPGENITMLPNNYLTMTSLKGKKSSVKPEMQKLIERVRRKASKPGAKSKLARWLDVAPARVSEWLSGKKEPGGEYTLRMLRWVEQQER